MLAALRPLIRTLAQDFASHPVAAAGAAVVNAAGPWLATIGSMLVIAHHAEKWVGDDVIDVFRGIVIYAFALSLVAAAPVVLVASRLLSGDLSCRRLAVLRPLFASALVLAAAASVVLALVVFSALLRIPLDMAAIGTAMTAIVAMIWVGLAFCSALRDTAWIATGFALGLSAATVAACICAVGFRSPLPMALAYSGGLGLVAVWLGARVLATFPATDNAVLAQLQRLVRAIATEAPLALGAILAAASLWLDKWLVWGSSLGSTIPGGLLQAPLYDSPQFVANFTVIPAFVLFATLVDTTILRRFRGYFLVIEGHATLAEIRRHSSALADAVLSGVVRILVVQGALSTAVLMASAAVIEATDLEFRHLPTFRYCVVGAPFHFLFLATSALLVFFERYRRFALLQAIFVALLAVATCVSLHFETHLLGLGYLVACVLGGVMGFFVLAGTLGRLDFFTFVAGNAGRSPIT